MPQEWLDAAQRSPVWRLISEYRIALPLHPEYRTLPMVWYVPPLSPVLDAVGAAGRDDTDADDVFHAISELRIPWSTWPSCSPRATPTRSPGC
jgi:nitrate reductase beta subunit